jgi:proteic killer suppression protein
MPPVIVSFGDGATEDLCHNVRSARGRRFPPDIVEPAIEKLDMIHAARALRDLGSPPGNRLEALRGDLRGFHSTRVNRQWRVIFRWRADGAHDVSVTDYH